MTLYDTNDEITYITLRIVSEEASSHLSELRTVATPPVTHHCGMNAAPGGSNKPKQRDKQDKPRAAEHQNIIIQQLSIQTGTAIRLVAVLKC